PARLVHSTVPVNPATPGADECFFAVSGIFRFFDGTGDAMLSSSQVRLFLVDLSGSLVALSFRGLNFCRNLVIHDKQVDSDAACTMIRSRTCSFYRCIHHCVVVVDFEPVIDAWPL